MLLHRIIHRSKAEGPGWRCVVWVQGCSICCPGCAVPQTWDKNGGFERDVDSLTEEILAIPDIEGITFLGGEPFDQAAPLTELVKQLRTAGLSIMVFTGYDYDFLYSADCPDWNALLNQIDLLADGPFIESLHSTDRPWIGSSNQNFRFLTDCYLDWKDHLPELLNRIEVQISPDGQISLNGMAPMETWNKLVKMLQNNINPLNQSNDKNKIGKVAHTSKKDTGEIQ